MNIHEIIESSNKKYEEAQNAWNEGRYNIEQYKDATKWIKYYKEIAIEELTALFGKTQ